MNTPRKFVLVLTLTFLAATIARAQVYTAFLSGPAESPPNASPGTGMATVTLNLATHTFRVQINFTGLTGTTTAAHIHAPVTVPGGTAGVATQTPTFSGFPLGVTSGNYDNTFDMTLTGTWNSSYIAANGGTAAGAEMAFASALQNGTAYVNIHTSTFGGGEIRGFLVPEPGTIALLSLGGAGLLALLRKRRS